MATAKRKPHKYLLDTKLSAKQMRVYEAIRGDIKKAKKMGLDIENGTWGVSCVLDKGELVLPAVKAQVRETADGPEFVFEGDTYLEDDFRNMLVARLETTLGELGKKARSTLFELDGGGVCALAAVLAVKKKVPNGTELKSVLDYAADLLGIDDVEASSVIDGFDNAGEISHYNAPYYNIGVALRSEFIDQ